MGVFPDFTSTEIIMSFLTLTFLEIVLGVDNIIFISITSARLAEEDKKKRELVEAKNTAESLIFQTEKLIKDTGDKLGPENIKKLEDKIQDTKNILAKSDVTIDEIKRATESLSEEAQKIGEEAYKNAQTQQQASSQSQEQNTSSNDQNTVNGEYEEFKK